MAADSQRAWHKETRGDVPGREKNILKRKKKSDLSHANTFWAARVKETNKMAAAQVSAAISEPKRSLPEIGMKRYEVRAQISTQLFFQS